MHTHGNPQLSMYCSILTTRAWSTLPAIARCAYLLPLIRSSVFAPASYSFKSKQLLSFRAAHTSVPDPKDPWSYLRSVYPCCDAADSVLNPTEKADVKRILNEIFQATEPSFSTSISESSSKEKVYSALSERLYHRFIDNYISFDWTSSTTVTITK